MSYVSFFFFGGGRAGKREANKLYPIEKNIARTVADERLKPSVCMFSPAVEIAY